MKKTAIVIAELPKMNGPIECRNQWLHFSESVQRIGKLPKNMNQITENIWQIPLDNGLPFLAQLFDLAENNKISIRALILDEPPAWITHPPAS